MTRDQFLEWLREQQRPGAMRVTPKPPSREPGDETEFESVGTFADRLQTSLNDKRLTRLAEDARRETR